MADNDLLAQTIMNGLLVERVSLTPLTRDEAYAIARRLARRIERMATLQPEPTERPKPEQCVSCTPGLISNFPQDAAVECFAQRGDKLCYYHGDADPNAPGVVACPEDAECPTLWKNTRTAERHAAEVHWPAQARRQS